MQIGGHIELNETPWQAVAHELFEESGYKLDELKVLQSTTDRVAETSNVAHPTPFSMNTHLVGNEHFHSDLCYGFIAEAEPSNNVAAGEADDLRWMSLEELTDGANESTVLKDVVAIYKFLLDHMLQYSPVSAREFSVDKPKVASATYKRGAPGSS